MACLLEQKGRSISVSSFERALEALLEPEPTRHLRARTLRDCKSAMDGSGGATAKRVLQIAGKLCKTWASDHAQALMLLIGSVSADLTSRWTQERNAGWILCSKSLLAASSTGPVASRRTKR
mgnify:CR=1 FL=1